MSQREILKPDVQPGRSPQLGRGCTVMRVYFVADHGLNAILWKYVQQRGIERAGSQRRVEKPHLRVLSQVHPDIAEHVNRKLARCRKLAQPIPLRPVLGSVQTRLKRYPALFHVHGVLHQLQPILRKILNAVLPHPVNAFRRFIAQIPAVEIPA